MDEEQCEDLLLCLKLLTNLTAKEFLDFSEQCKVYNLYIGCVLNICL